MPLLCPHPLPPRVLGTNAPVAPQGEGHRLTGVGKADKDMDNNLVTLARCCGATGIPLSPPRVWALCADGSQDAKVRGLAAGTLETLVPCWAIPNTQVDNTASLCVTPPASSPYPEHATLTPGQPGTGVPQ